MKNHELVKTAKSLREVCVPIPKNVDSFTMPLLIPVVGGLNAICSNDTVR